MFGHDKKFEKKQRMFKKMTPQELCLYCDKHPLYSLPAGVRNHRTKEAMAIMEDCAQNLTQDDRGWLASYVQSTFSRGNIVVSSSMLEGFYSPLFKREGFKSAPLKKAINEFVGFSLAPMDNAKKRWIAEFVDHVMPQARKQKATEFQKGMDEYRQRTCLFNH